jgi:hypothetical protein
VPGVDYRLVDQDGHDVPFDGVSQGEVRSPGRPLSYSRNGISIFVLLLYSGYALGKVAVRFRSSTVPQ